MTVRILFSVKDEVLARFRAIVPNRERSKAIESFMLKEIETREDAREREIEQIARMVESDPAFAEVRGVATDVDAVAGDAVD
jgi:flagellar motor component MotA